MKLHDASIAPIKSISGPPEACCDRILSILRSHSSCQPDAHQSGKVNDKHARPHHFVQFRTLPSPSVSGKYPRRHGGRSKLKLSAEKK